MQAYTRKVWDNKQIILALRKTILTVFFKISQTLAQIIFCQKYADISYHLAASWTYSLGR